MIKKLALLGLLRGQELHGYGLLEFLSAHSDASGVGIGKSNAYRLLHSLEADGLVFSESPPRWQTSRAAGIHSDPGGGRVFSEWRIERVE